MMPIIYIKKEAGERKNAFRCTKQGDIPSFLENAVRIEGAEAVLYSLEGIERIPLDRSPVIAWEEVELSRITDNPVIRQSADGSYYNVWCRENADTTLTQKDGAFYEKARVCTAQLCVEEVPDFLGAELAANVRFDPDGKCFRYRPGWLRESDPPLTAKPYAGFWIKYGEPDGDFAFLEMGTPSADEYLVCDEKGNVTEPLNQYYRRLGVGIHKA